MPQSQRCKLQQAFPRRANRHGTATLKRAGESSAGVQAGRHTQPWRRVTPRGVAVRGLFEPQPGHGLSLCKWPRLCAHSWDQKLWAQVLTLRAELPRRLSLWSLWGRQEAVWGGLRTGDRLGAGERSPFRRNEPMANGGGGESWSDNQERDVCPSHAAGKKHW